MKNTAAHPASPQNASVSSVEKKIALVRNKMIGTVAVVLGLGIWQQKFVLDGIAAHMEITLTILGTFAFSTVLAFVFIAKLKNEVVAYKALREMWDDIQHGARRHEGDPDWRLDRCRQPAQVFERPRLLGHAYELVTEELARTKKMRVSVETMNTFVHTVESSINDEKSLIIYLSGLLVFMGLIGTFIGLLHMVGSIGGIIGSLASSTSGSGGGDTTAAFTQLLAALQEPLHGMAAGFAASLFGLFSSLVVGLLGRFAGQAAGVLKSEFEGWLAGVVQIGEEQEESAHHGGAAVAVGALQDPALLRMVGNILGDYTRVAGQFEQVGGMMHSLQATQARQSETIDLMARHFGQFEAGRGPAGAVEQVAAAAVRLESVAQRMSEAMVADHTAMREAIEELGRQHGTNLRLLTSNQVQTANRLADAIEMVSTDIARRAEADQALGTQGVAAEAASRVLAGLERNPSPRLVELEESLTRLAEGQEMLNRTLAQELPRLARTTSGSEEGGVAEGLGRINQTMDAALTAYSGLLHVALAAMERAGRNQPETAPVAVRNGTER